MSAAAIVAHDPPPPAEIPAVRSPRVLIVVNDARFTVTHFLALARGISEAGGEVEIAVPDAPEVSRIAEAGFRVHSIPLDRRGMNPLSELRLYNALLALYRDRRPAAVHHITVKPVLYGTIAARRAGVPRIVNSVTGLGYLFVSGGRRRAPVRAVIGAAYRRAFADSRVRLVFENPDDRDLFVRMKLVASDRTLVVPGAGVDVEEFRSRPVPAGTPLVVLPARMLWDKGVREFVEAARLIRTRGVAARFVLVGGTDVNRAAVPVAQLDAWAREGVVEWWGLRDDMPTVLAEAALVVLPSYREGCPKALLEAAASGRAIVTCDVPGCREAVRDGANGVLVPARDADALAAAISTLLADPARRDALGRAGRVRAEREFAVRRVVGQILSAYAPLFDAALCSEPA